MLNWHWIFFVNLPIGAVTAVLARAVHRPDRGAGLRPGADLPGALLITGAMMLGVYTIVSPAAEQGWLGRETLSLGAGSLVLLAAFVIRQKHRAPPADAAADLPLAQRDRRQPGPGTRRRPGMFGMFFLGSLYLRQILRYDPLQIGLAFLPVAVVMGDTVGAATPTGWSCASARAHRCFPGLGLIAAGLALFATAPAGGGAYLSHISPGRCC